jgi:hypothetical protein
MDSLGSDVQKPFFLLFMRHKREKRQKRKKIIITYGKEVNEGIARQFSNVLGSEDEPIPALREIRMGF